MKSNLFHVVLAIFLVTGTWFASNGRLDKALETSVPQVRPVNRIREADVMNLRTGDSFWGFHLGGVVPCSSLLVKGGGHIVTLSPQNDRDARCIYHVVGEKAIELQGKKFRLRVVAPDQVRVEREPASKPAVASR